MKTTREMKKLLLICSALILVISLSACAQNKIRLGTIPAPAATNKLRVVVYPISDSTTWHVSQDEYAHRQYRAVSRNLEMKGIYEVVPEKDVIAVTGDEWLPGWKFKADDWAIAKQVARALYADYVVITERGKHTVRTHYWRMMLLNAENGKLFSFEGMVQGGMQEDYQPVVQTAYRSIFNEAKADMLSNAIRKGRLMPPRKKPFSPLDAGPAQVASSKTVPESGTVSAETENKPLQVAAKSPDRASPGSTPSPETGSVKIQQKPDASQAAVKKPRPPVPRPVQPTPTPVHSPRESENIVDKSNTSITNAKVADARRNLAKEPGKGSTAKSESAAKNRLVVYDFISSGNLDVVALILTEALREELFQIGQFVLINRENISQIVEELKLQQSGLVDEKQTVQIGKWLAANESVTGRLDSLGNSYTLFAKRTDIQSLSTLGMGSLKCTAGREEELLNGMSLLAKKLASLPER